jgi:hypothetical protein
VHISAELDLLQFKFYGSELEMIHDKRMPQFFMTYTNKTPGAYALPGGVRLNTLVPVWMRSIFLELYKIPWFAK